MIAASLPLSLYHACAHAHTHTLRRHHFRHARALLPASVYQRRAPPRWFLMRPRVRSEFAPALSYFIKQLYADTGQSYLSFESAFHEGGCPAAAPGTEALAYSSAGMQWTEVMRRSSPTAAGQGGLTPFNFAAPIALLTLCCACALIRSLWDERRAASQLVAEACSRSTTALGQASEAVGSAVGGAVGGAVPAVLSTSLGSLTEVSVAGGQELRRQAARAGASSKLSLRGLAGKLRTRRGGAESTARRAEIPAAVSASFAEAVPPSAVEVMQERTAADEVDRCVIAPASAACVRLAGRSHGTRSAGVGATVHRMATSITTSAGGLQQLASAEARRSEAANMKMNHGMMLRRLMQDTAELKALLRE